MIGCHVRECTLGKLERKLRYGENYLSQSNRNIFDRCNLISYA